MSTARARKRSPGLSGLSPQRLDRIADRLLREDSVDRWDGSARGEVVSPANGKPIRRPQIETIPPYTLPKKSCGLICSECGKPRSWGTASRCRSCWRNRAAQKYYEAQAALEYWTKQASGYEYTEDGHRAQIAVTDD